MKKKGNSEDGFMRDAFLFRNLSLFPRADTEHLLPELNVFSERAKTETL